MGDGMMQIGEVAAQVGLSLRTIRHYEEVGLVVPSGRSAGGFRLYTPDDALRLGFVKQLKPLEFTLDEIRELLAARDALSGTRVDIAVADALDRLDGFATVAAQRCERLREQLAAAESVASELRRVVRRGQRAGSRR